MHANRPLRGADAAAIGTTTTHIKTPAHRSAAAMGSTGQVSTVLPRWHRRVRFVQAWEATTTAAAPQERHSGVAKTATTATTAPTMAPTAAEAPRHRRGGNGDPAPMEPRLRWLL